MSGDVHVRFRERLRGRFPGATRPVVHCRSLKQAEEVKQSIASRLKECELTMHPEKSKMVHCKQSGRIESHAHVQFTFLGYTFRPREARNKRNQLFTSFLPGVSDEAMKKMRQTVRGWKLHRQTPATLAELAQQYNPIQRYEDG